jgi:type 1 fimbria pilin
MIIRRQLLIACFCVLGVNTLNAAQSPPTTGVIRFTGQIVEAGCTAGGVNNSSIELHDCPQASLGQTFAVQQASARNTDDANQRVFAQIVADNHDQETYYDQRFLLVDGSGLPITTGNYIVTLAVP